MLKGPTLIWINGSQMLTKCGSLEIHVGIGHGFGFGFGFGLTSLEVFILEPKWFQNRLRFGQTV